jgi:hypothetical protein
MNAAGETAEASSGFELGSGTELVLDEEPNVVDLDMGEESVTTNVVEFQDGGRQHVHLVVWLAAAGA